MLPRFDFYTALRTFGDIEVRDYAAYAVAEVLLSGAASEVGNQAFPILAGYIFGKNKGERKFAMTAPVIQSAESAQAIESVKLPMTAPVTQTAATGGYLIQNRYERAKIATTSSGERLCPSTHSNSAPALKPSN